MANASQAAEAATLAELQAQMAALMAKNEELESKLKSQESQKGIFLKPAAKGGLSLYGLNRSPLTLYANQWRRVLVHVEDLQLALEAGDALGIWGSKEKPLPERDEHELKEVRHAYVLKVKELKEAREAAAK